MIAEFFSALFTDITAFFDKPLGFGGPLITGHIIIWALLIGFGVAGLISLYNRLFIGKFVTFLLKNKAETPESARSLEDAGVKNPFIKALLRSNGTLSKLIKTQDEGSGLPDRRYYIEKADSERADRLYSHGGASVMTLVITLILLVAAAAVIYTVLPELIQMAENFAGMIKPGKNIA